MRMHWASGNITSGIIQKGKTIQFVLQKFKALLLREWLCFISPSNTFECLAIKLEDRSSQKLYDVPKLLGVVCPIPHAMKTYFSQEKIHILFLAMLALTPGLVLGNKTNVVIRKIISIVVVATLFVDNILFWQAKDLLRLAFWVKERIWVKQITSQEEYGVLRTTGNKGDSVNNLFFAWSGIGLNTYKKSKKRLRNSYSNGFVHGCR